MWKNFFLTSVRNLKRNFSFSLLNIGGLALGIAACIVMLLFVNYENHFDHIHSKGSRIYRLTELQRFDGTPEQTVALSMYPMAAALQKDYPQVASVVRINEGANMTIRYKQKLITASQILFCDSNFLQVFDFPLKEGERTTAIDDPSRIVLTESMAGKIFGRTDVVGETIELYHDDIFQPFTVSGVAKDVPDNSHIQFDGLISFRAQKIKDWMNTWDANWLQTYVLINKNTDVSRLQAAMPSFLEKYLAKEAASRYQLNLQPFYDVHLGSENIVHDGLNYKKFSRSYVKIFLVIALFVLLIALLNFVNLSTARAAKRAREVGIRKTIGAQYWQLVKQFIGEAVLFTFLALLIASLIIWIALPFVSQIVQRDIHFDLFTDPRLWLGLLALALITGMLAGFYPALLLSSYRPVTVLKGVIRTSGSKRWSLRNVLVISQFAIAVVLIVSTLLIVQQLNYIKDRDIGFDQEHIITMTMNKTANEHFDLLKTELLKNSDIVDVTGYNQRLGNNINQMGAEYVNDSGEQKHLSLSHLVVDYDYLNLYNIKLKEGRNFSKDMQDEKGRSYIINETLANEMGVKHPVGTPYKAAWLKEMGRVIGVAKDFNFNSLHSKIAPLYISMQDWDFNEIAVKLKAGSTEKDLAYVKSKWQSLVPDLPFSYSFLDEHMAQLYETDRRVSKVVSISTALAVIIACLGLFGIVLFNIQSRTKEIGIRKVLGANVATITSLLSMEFLRPVLIALLIAFPVAWWLMNKWLQDFAYRIEISWIVFLLSGLAAVLIALVTISFQTVKAAITNPVKSLRTE
jgi:putative ABC transport system permease protein